MHPRITFSKIILLENARNGKYGWVKLKGFPLLFVIDQVQMEKVSFLENEEVIASKIDNNNFIVLMFDVDMLKMKDLLATPERAEIMKKNGMSNEMFQFSPIA